MILNPKRIGYTGIILVLLLTLGWVRYAGANRTDEQILLASANDIHHGAQVVILKNDGNYESYSGLSEFKSMGQKLSIQLGLPPGTISYDADSHPIYKASRKDADGTVYTLYLAGLKGDNTYLIYQAERDKATNPALIHNVRDRMEKQLQAVGEKIHWNIMVQEELGNISSSRRKELLAQLMQTLRAKEVSRYTDSGSLSVSCHSEALNMQEARGQANVQIAFHVSTVDGTTRLTLGIPLISIDF